MDYKSELSLVPEWLKNSGRFSATVDGTTISSLLDDGGVLKPARTKSSDSLRMPGLERAPSSYFCRNNYSSNGSVNTRSYSSFSINQHNRDWDFSKAVYREKSIFSDYRPNRDYSDPSVNNLRRSRSSISRKEPVTDLIKSNGNMVVRGANKASFERVFPSLVAEERRIDTEINRVPSPVLRTIQNLPIGSSAVVSSDGWTSTLAEVPVIVTNKGSGGSALFLASVSIPVTGSILNMAETVAQGPCVKITSQMSSGTQRLEELALKQSRQLIPVISSIPKTLVLNASDKSKPKIGTHQLNSSRGGPAKSDLSKTSAIGKLHVLKPTRERNNVSTVLKDNKNINNDNCVSPINIAKSPNNPLVVAPLRNLGSNPIHAGLARKPALSEKRLTPNTDFFNLVRKKSINNSSLGTSNPDLAVSSTLLNKPGETEAADIPLDRDNPALDRSCGAHNGKILIPYAEEEEEVLLLRSMGWDENSGDDEGLTEEEINDFLSKYANSKPSANVFPRLGSAQV